MFIIFKGTVLSDLSEVRPKKVTQKDVSDNYPARSGKDTVGGVSVSDDKTPVLLRILLSRRTETPDLGRQSRVNQGLDVKG